MQKSLEPRFNIVPAAWRTPIVLLAVMAIANQLSMQTWLTLVNNFATNAVNFTGREIGILHSIREIPGFLSFGVVFVLLLMREQTLAFLALLLLGLGVAISGYYPSALGFYVTTLISSIGFHYYEATAQSLALQWLPKTTAARGLGRIAAASSFAAFLSFGLIYLTFTLLGLGFAQVYLISGGLTLLLVAYLWMSFPYFPQETLQRKDLFLRKRYWLFYALTFMWGARRQIFIVFAGFMMVEKFHYSVTAITTLFLINHICNMAFAPLAGQFITRFGERRALLLEYGGLICVFTAYAFVQDATVAGVLYVLDHAFFAMSIALKTYFQKIADPADIAPTSGVSFTINHMAAVVLPAALGLVWLTNPGAVFLLGAGFAACSFGLALLVPRFPMPGQETLWQPRALQAAE